MKRFAVTTPLMLLLALATSAQSYEGTVDYQKKNEKAIIIEFPYPPSVVQDAIADKFEKMGFKKKDTKGYLVYKNIVLADISPEPADYLVRVDKKSRKEKDESIVYLMIYHSDQNITSTTDGLTANSKAFLDSLSPDLEAYSLEVQIKDQDAALAKAQKKLKDLQDNQSNMERKVKNLQSDLEQNARDQDNQQKEIDRQRQILEAMKAKRKV